MKLTRFGMAMIILMALALLARFSGPQSTSHESGMTFVTSSAH